MSFIGSMFDDSKGAGFQGQSTPITYGANGQQAGTAYDQTQQGLAQQQAFMQALQGQNGIGNQSSVFNQLQGVANGTGPNPAQAMLNQQTGNNISQQAALMAGQRGAGANAGLLARQAAMQGGALQQQAVGQGATMQANQSMNALNQLGGIAGQQVGQQANALTGYNQAAQGQQQNVLNAIGQQNQANVGMQSNINNANAGIAHGNQQFQQDVLKKTAGGAGAAMGMPMAHGGEVHPAHEPQSFVTRHLKGYAQGGVTPPAEQSASELAGPPMNSSSSEGSEGKSSGIDPAQIAQLAAMAAYKGGTATKSMKAGGGVPGKAKVKGDSLKNDTVKAILSPGEVVIPRSVMQSEDPSGNAAKFVAACMAKHGGGLKKGSK